MNPESAVMRLFRLCLEHGWVVRLASDETGEVELEVYDPDAEGEQERFWYGPKRTSPEIAAEAALEHLPQWRLRVRTGAKATKVSGLQRVCPACGAKPDKACNRWGSICAERYDPWEPRARARGATAPEGS